LSWSLPGNGRAEACADVEPGARRRPREGRRIVDRALPCGSLLKKTNPSTSRPKVSVSRATQVFNARVP
jgi:hypothetical protein